MKATMPEETQKLPPLFDPADPATPDYYAQLVNVSMANSDVVLCFGRQLEGLIGKITTQPQVRVTLTHNNFIQMVNFLSGYSNFLSAIYGDSMPTLEGAAQSNPDRFQKAADLYLGVKAPSEESEED